MGLGTALRAPQLGRNHDLAYRFLGQRNAMSLLQILGRQGRPEVAIMRPDQRAHLGHGLRGQPPITRLPAAPRAQSRRTLVCHLGLQPAHLPFRQPQPPGRFRLRDLPGSAQCNDLYPFQFLLTHAGLHHAPIL